MSEYREIKDEAEVKNEAKKPIDPEEQIRKFAKGKLELTHPIRSGGKDIDTLHFDFNNMTGTEYVDALDSDPRANNLFRLSSTQALNLFASSAAKNTDGIDAEDILSRIGAQDAMKAIQVTTVFFIACNRAGSKRISNE